MQWRISAFLSRDFNLVQAQLENVTVIAAPRPPARSASRSLGTSARRGEDLC